MKLVLSFLISCFSFLLIAQNNLEGTWNATTYVNENVNLLSQEWLINEDAITINSFKDGEKKNWGVFNYEQSDNQISLTSEETNLTFDILEMTTQRVVIKSERYIIYLENRAFLKESKIDIPYLQPFKMVTENQYECPQCTFIFLNISKRNYLFTFRSDSVISTSIINECSNPNYQKAVITPRELDGLPMLFDYLKPETITGFINRQTPFQFKPKQSASIISTTQLCQNPILQKGSTKLFQLTSEKKKTVFVGKEKLQLNEDRTGDYTYLMRIGGKNVQVSAEVNWKTSKNNEYLFVSYTQTQKDDNDLFAYSESTILLNVYSIRQTGEEKWELKKTLHGSPFFY